MCTFVVLLSYYYDLIKTVIIFSWLGCVQKVGEYLKSCLHLQELKKF
jgi:hypothetical protein